MDAVVPAEKSIKTKSNANVDSDRLHRRLAVLRDLFAGGYSPQASDDGRATFRARVRETMNIERELTLRGEDFRVVTDGSHLTVGPLEHRVRGQ